MRISPYIWAFLAAAAVLIPALQAPALPPPEVRVLISEGPRVTVDGLSQNLRASIGEGREAGSFTAGTQTTVAATAEGIAVGESMAGREVQLTTPAQRFRIGERTYRGALTIVWQTPAKLQVIDAIPLEDYLVGLIGSEISPAWPAEAIKAQAVAARTYAMYQSRAASGARKIRAYDVTSTVLSQVYDGAHKEDDRSREAVAATRGQVLTRDGAIFASYFHSCCGGLTEHAHNVWTGEDGPPAVEDRFCERSPKRQWSFQMPAAAFAEKLRANGVRVGSVVGISTESESDSPRVEDVILQDRDSMATVKATELRKIFGYSEIKSTWFDATLDNGEITLVGRGYGHGVGMCQWGAKGMADEGKSYREILKFYYPDAELYTAY